MFVVQVKNVFYLSVKVSLLLFVVILPLWAKCYRGTFQATDAKLKNFKNKITQTTDNNKKAAADLNAVCSICSDREEIRISINNRLLTSRF